MFICLFASAYSKVALFIVGTLDLRFFVQLIVAPAVSQDECSSGQHEEVVKDLI